MFRNSNRRLENFFTCFNLIFGSFFGTFLKHSKYIVEKFLGHLVDFSFGNMNRLFEIILLSIVLFKLEILIKNKLLNAVKIKVTH